MVNRDADIDVQLEALAQAPQTFLNQRLKKRDARTGQVLSSVPSAFTAEDIASNRFVEQRDQLRKKTCTERQGELIRLEQILPGRAPFQDHDRAENLVDALSSPLLRRLEDMEAEKLTSASLKDSPWSDYYWPIYQGVLGARYADSKNPRTQNWQELRNYHQSRTLRAVSDTGTQKEVDLLSPAEKYDLLLGHLDGPLTDAMWEQGRAYFERDGAVETWMGICHGWSPASFMLPRPQRVVNLPSADGRFNIRFFPSDLKGLGSLLWAMTRPPTRFIGGRCNDKKPKTDANGRVKSEACFDTNPGTWHLAVVNQIGVAKRGMIIDATYDYEVWNQPLFGYSYSYFNPQTRKRAAKLRDAQVEKSAFGNDLFKSYRSKKGVSMVGIAMDIVYVVETHPNHNETDSAENDCQREVSYMYDLELDETGQIVGGEWYTNLHPDFLWTPPLNAKASTLADSAASGLWNAQQNLPESWRAAGLLAAQNGQPLEKIVNALFQLAK